MSAIRSKSIGDSSVGVVTVADHVRWLWPFVKPRLWLLSGVLLLATLLSVAATAQPYLTKLIIDDGLIARRLEVVWWGCAAIVALAGAAGLIGGLNRWLYVRVSGSILSELRERTYARLLKLPPEFFRNRAVGDLVTRLDGDVAEVQRFSTDTLLATVNATLVLAATIVVMLHLSPLLTVVTAAALPLQLTLRHYSRNRVRLTTTAVREQSSQIAHFLMETLGAAKGVQAAAAEEFELSRLSSLNRSFLSRVISQQMVGFVVGTGSTLLAHMTTAAVFVVGGRQVMEGHLTVGVLIAFVAYLTRGNGSALSLMNIYLAYQRASVSLGRLRELWRDEEVKKTDESASPSPQNSIALQLSPAPAIEFRRVTYTPPGVTLPLFEDFNWTIPTGAKLALAGASGAGKSSLVDLLRRFVTPERGEILIAGVPIERYDLQQLRRAVVVLDARPAIFHGTILFNVRYGHPQATAQEVLSAARRAGLGDVVASLPDGYETVLGTHGAGLSAGQRQRIAIARALLSRPAVLILDEATNSLDESAVKELHAAIDSQFPDLTRIVITHVNGGLDDASDHFTLHDGRILPTSADRSLHTRVG
jgi:ATP-binding cassette subfamily B protein